MFLFFYLQELLELVSVEVCEVREVDVHYLLDAVAVEKLVLAEALDEVLLLTFIQHHINGNFGV